MTQDLGFYSLLRPDLTVRSYAVIHNLVFTVTPHFTVRSYVVIYKLMFTVTPHFTVRSHAMTWNVNISVLRTAGF